MTTSVRISFREGASPANSWSESLYLTSGTARRYRLFVGGYAGLAEASAYRNEHSGEYDLPNEIDGVAVVGIEDEMVVGGEITWFDDADTVEFDSLFEPIVRDWLAERGWREPRAIKLIEQALTDATPTTG